MNIKFKLALGGWKQSTTQSHFTYVALRSSFCR